MRSHPIHPMLVHFPIACWSLATFLDVIGFFYLLPVEWLAGLLILTGLTLAIPAMLAGLVDMAKIEEHSPALKTVNQHMVFVMVTWIVYGLSTYLRMEGRDILSPDGLGVACSIIGLICLGVTGWLGGKLVYEYRVGVEDHPHKVKKV